jgi:cellulose synthase/poly-beta-1,6-N-acetylglucosamine synthase-like glycosyltransferase
MYSNMAKTPKLVSIIIVVKNDRGIAATLEHLESLPVDVPHETIVVDASESSRLVDIKALYPEIIWDQFPVSVKRTTAEQRNRGIVLAKGDVIVFIDANCIPDTGWLQAIVSSIRAGEDIVCGPVHDLSESNLVHYAPALIDGKYVDVCTTISVGLRREVFNKVGNFDTSFLFGQDVDFFWRAHDAGYKIYYNPLVAIGHDWGEPKEQLHRAFVYGKSRAHLFKKHWKRRRGQLLREPHVWVYPLFILGLPVTYFIPFYPLLILIPLIKNRSDHPFGLILHHLFYAFGVIAGVLKQWPKA